MIVGNGDLDSLLSCDLSLYGYFFFIIKSVTILPSDLSPTAIFSDYCATIIFLCPFFPEGLLPLMSIVSVLSEAPNNPIDHQEHTMPEAKGNNESSKQISHGAPPCHPLP